MAPLRTWLPLVLVLLLAVSTAQAKIIYVRLTWGGNGSSWDQAMGTVLEALTAANSGDQIWVARGVHHGHFTLKAGVAMYGGFAATETSVSQRDLLANTTVLDGDGNGIPMIVQPGADASTRLDGFTVCNSNGPGILCGSGASATITNCLIARNRDGGIWVTDNSSPLIEGNRINTNMREGQNGNGGGIFCTGGGSPVIRRNKICGNGAQRGGGIAVLTASPTITGNVIAGNAAESQGGGLYLDLAAGLVANNTLVGNDAVGDGGGIFATPATVSCEVANNIIVDGSSGLCGPVPLDAHHNCLHGNAAYQYKTVAPGVGDVAADPLLADVAYGNFHLQPASPCRDTGEAGAAAGAAELDGQARVQGVGVDIGADETTGVTWAAGPYVTIYVSEAGDDYANDGTAWARAKSHLQPAVDRAAAQGGEVWVAGGGYYQPTGMSPFVYVYGGFAGNETTRRTGDPTLHPSSLRAPVTWIGGRTWSRLDGFYLLNVQDEHGALCCVYGSPTITGNRVVTCEAYRNSAWYPGGGLYCYRGNPVVENNLFDGNHGSYGGGIFAQRSNPVIRANRFLDNIAAVHGGGIYSTEGNPLVAGNTFRQNVGGQGGGGLFFLRGRPTVTNNLVMRCYAPLDLWAGGGLRVEDVADGSVFRNNTLADNDAQYGAGIFYHQTLAPVTVTVANNIIAFNNHGEGFYFDGSGSRPVLQDNCVAQNYGLGYYGLDPGESDFALDPLFVDRDNDDYRLLSTSPCLDAGDTSLTEPGELDAAGLARVLGPAVDIGAYEWRQAASTPTAPSDLAAGTASLTSIRLTWVDHSGIETGFTVQRSLQATRGFATIGATGANVTTYTDPGLTTGTVYYYRVRATGVNGDSLFSNTASAAPAGPPAAPSSLTATVLASNRVRLAWHDNSGSETGFRIDRTPAFGSPVMVGSNVTTFTDATCAGHTAYSYHVHAVNGAGESAASNQVTVTTPTFDDVLPSSGQWAYVEAMAREKITSGCSQTPPLYCPTGAVTRGQMAVFLCRAAGWTPANPATASFSDVPTTSPLFGYVEAMKSHGVTGGCGGGKYCPDSPVTRGQMAVFLCRAAGTPTANPATPTFGDVPKTNEQYIYIEGIYAAKITAGCVTTPPLQYCPGSPVTRGQMAVFLCRAFGIPT